MATQSATSASPSRPKRRWLQFSLRTLLALLVLFSLPLGWLQARLADKRRERNALAYIQELGGDVYFNWTPSQGAAPPGPAWQRWLLGEDFFVQPSAVVLSGTQVTNKQLSHLTCLVVDPRVLGIAAASGKDAAQKVLMLLKRGADANQPLKDGRTPLLAALGTHQSNAAGVLLEAGADAHVHDDRGRNTLILAAKNGPAEALAHLLRLGFDPHERSRTRGNATTLILAAGSKQDAAEKVRLLIKRGASLDDTDDYGATALIAASRAGNMRAVIALADAGADVNQADRGGMTPLHYVANRGGNNYLMCEQTGGEAARSLIERGASTTARDSSRRTPRMFAEKIEHEEVIEVLNQAR